MAVNWKCPHGLSVKVGRRMGIPTYTHPDGKQCNYLAKYEFKVTKLDEHTAKKVKDFAKDDEMAYLLCETKTYVRWLVKRLSSLKGDDLEAELQRQYKIGTLNFITHRLARIFGECLADNIRVLGISPEIAAKARKHGHGVKPKAKMSSLFDNEIEEAATRIGKMVPDMVFMDDISFDGVDNDDVPF